MAVGACGAVTVTVIDAVPVAPFESVAVSVIVCVPTDNVLVENPVPVPICPLRLLVHTSDAPLSVPSSGSVPVPANETLVPCTTLVLFAGAEIAAVGGWFTISVIVAVPVRLCEFFAVSVIVCVPPDNVLVENDVPVPIWPLMLLVHTSEAPLNVPSSGSVPLPAKLTLEPT